MNAIAKIDDEQEAIEDKKIKFIDGIPGFVEYKNYIIELNEDSENPFHKLQSVDEPELSFIIVNPFLFKEDYEFDIPKSAIERLEIRDKSDILVYSIVVVPEDYTKMTANLQAPIIINTKNMIGKQVILNENIYTTKHYILEEMNKE
ncbi:flagellar assembly protein FliW [Gottschalkia acidurici]|nr:flagellar assembly protein FliW [Gottschalkia acidurici]